jgi:hypothetical protein
MTTATILSWVLAAVPIHPSTSTDVPIAYAAPGPTIHEALADETVEPDGRRVRWASVTYELSNGRQAEAFVEVDEHGRAVALIYSDGEPLVHVTTDGRGNDTAWVAPNVDLPPEDFSQLLSADVANEVFAGIGNEQLAAACSEKTKWWIGKARYVWAAAVAYAGVACCASVGGPTLGAGCVICTGLAAVAGLAGDDVASEYCS